MSSTDRQLLFAVLALQLEFITAQQFAEICTVWATRKNRSLAELLADRGWLNKQDHSDIERLLTRKIERHGGDLVATLREAGQDERVKGSLASIPDVTIHRSLMPTPPPQGLSLMATRAFVPDGSERYTLSHVHRTGGIGRVWLAHDVALRREVALKELRPDRSSNEAMWTMFLREARITGQLEHPGIVPIYEVGQRPDDKGPFYTMRFIRGQTLAEAADQYHSRLKKGEAGPLELRSLLAAFVGVCNAVGYAHSRGVLHRDLKPQNVVLGAFGEVIVLDWGLARLTGEPEPGPPPMDLGSKDGLESTRQGHVVGTPAYMSPEQAQGRLDILGPPTDVYGLGAVLLHILTNEPPYSAPTPEEIQTQVVNDPVKPPHLRAVGVPPALDAVCLKALSKKPDDRYESASALADEVQHWLADEPVQAYPEPVAVRASRWARRHKAVVSAATVFMAVSVIALATASTLIYREKRATENVLDSSNDFALKIVEGADRSVGDVQRLRLSMSQAGVGLLKDIRKERPEDGRTAATLARLLQFEATAKRVSGQLADAEAGLKESIALLEPFLAKEPENAIYRSVCASSHTNLGSVQMLLGRRIDAAASHQRAIDLYESPAREDQEARFHRALAANELAIVHFGWKPVEEARKSSLEAVAMLQGLMGPGTMESNPQVCLLYSGALNRTALCLFELDLRAEGFRMLDRSGRMMERLLSLHPNDRDVRHFRALVWLHHGHACSADQGREKEAVDSLQRAAEVWRGLLVQWPDFDRYRSLFAEAIAGRADLYRRQNRPKDAETALASAEEALSKLSKESRTTGDSRLCRARVAAVRLRLAKDSKDAARIKECTATAKMAHQELLQSVEENRLLKREAADLEREVQAAGS
jgi:tetratricopeptide (TPR) repeat protein/tRNA A-37 threonylcarbamoyl transferase component Bud32